MNKSELVAQLAEKWVWPKSKAQMALDGVLEIIKTALAKGEDVTLPGFGTFTVADKPERQGRNPKTGEPLTIAALKTPKFKPGKALKDAVN
ncbi:HU family DNA-binding protein [Neisseria weaveri]|uniref:HU family DNA-binding protein n=1 Tax=Neisseria weaveri TaxID=28091 RepID=UPI000D30714E|nr:HU family DNA-binding protein [Neisseria weaveri]